MVEPSSSRKDSVRERDMEEPVTTRLKRDPNHYLKQMVSKRLRDCGFYDEVLIMARDAVEELGMKPSSYREMCKALIPKARLLVPPGVRKELEANVRAALKAKR
ncbi:hypothetical protein AWZ03_013426 [Drosophila navojoa]|uniref:Uncharacterized protein n=1 Tax=Drosophila navojoa TaxID=7232 RepID=A0A484AX09_DRONA|nr:hypothetical protein AWZ03_013426 [Drosophila navojoa]